VPDVWLDETAEGNVFAALRMREADLKSTWATARARREAAKGRTPAREKAREEARKKLEEQQAKKEPVAEAAARVRQRRDFQLQQALNQPAGKPVMVSKTQTERKAEAKDQLSRAAFAADPSPPLATPPLRVSGGLFVFGSTP
jgi:carboxyl-terminal processing protease